MLRSCLLLLVACGPGAADVVAPPGSGPATTPDQAPDTDGDGVRDDADNCLEVANPDQDDLDANGIGDACDVAPDLDVDGVPDHLDNCRGAANADQLDGDDDGRGDVCDNCPEQANYDQADADGDGVGDACPCDACGKDWCVQHPSQAVTCETDCPIERQGSDQTCCPFGSRWGAAAGMCLLPDLQVDAASLESSLSITQEDFAADACELTDGCVLGSGTRTVLRFDLTLTNLGDGDLHLGAPDTAAFVTSECLDAPQLDALVTYELLASDGSTAVPARSQGRCIGDDDPWQLPVGPDKYDCDYQGLTRGYAATFDSDLPCQLVDVTGVASGTYTLRVEVDAGGLLAEGDTSNNVTEVQVVVP